MTETGVLLAATIERILRGTSPVDVERQGPDEGGPDAAQLLSTLNDYLTLPIPHDLRSSAVRVAELSRNETKPGEPSIGFLAALEALRVTLDSHLEQEEAAKQLADDPEMLQEFLVESRAHLSHIEVGTLRLENNTDDSEALNSVFRSFHTIKGLSGFLGAAAIQELAHETENVLDRARSGELTTDPEIVDLILRAADELSRCLDAAAGGNVREMPRCELALLEALSQVAHRSVAVGTDSLRGDPGGPVMVPTGTAGIASPVPGRELACKPGAEAAIPSPPTVSETSVVRIETSKLEYLIDMVGELVIAESVVRHDPVLLASGDPLLSRNLTQLGRVVQEVQKTSMSMRMVAVGTLFRKMSRLVRDLARKSGKHVEMTTVGDDVELDRSIVEDLADPMVHMIRNAVDHGLETVSERLAAGKAEKGTIRLQAAHDAGEIVIQISDDGRGLAASKILAKARAKGLVPEDANPDEESIFKLIFEPGFSTAEKVTDMSGRGVGMDVVRKQIQKLRGHIGIRSTPGKGCVFVLRLPLTLAIIDGLVVGVGSQRFILPMFAVREMFAPEPETIITLENRAEAANFRGRLYPIVRLSRLTTGCNEVVPAQPVASGICSERINTGVLVVVESREQLFCIAVDQLIGKQEVVIKSLGRTFRDVPAISGGAILGDGRVGLIIDVNSLRTGRQE